MFYYRIEVTDSAGRLDAQHMEALKPAHVGERVASLLAKRPRRVEVEPISQADYVAAMRPKD